MDATGTQEQGRPAQKPAIADTQPKGVVPRPPGKQLPLDIPRDAAAVDSDSSPIPGAVLAWMRAVASHAPLRDHVEVLLSGELRLSKTALGFGQAPAKMYEALYAAGLVKEKHPDRVICTAKLAAAFTAAVENGKAA